MSEDRGASSGSTISRRRTPWYIAAAEVGADGFLNPVVPEDLALRLRDIKDTGPE